MKANVDQMSWWVHLMMIMVSIILIGNACSGTGHSETILLDVFIESGVMNPKDIVVTQQDKITINITSDRLGLIHIHGYDVERDLEKGKQIKFELQAYAAGKFKITFHGYGEHNDHKDSHEEFIIGSLTVNPN